MQLILERWSKSVEKTEFGEVEIETVVEEKVVSSEEEALSLAEEWKKKEGTSKVTLHYHYHEEGKPCERKEL
jgi:hypothetical protein